MARTKAQVMKDEGVKVTLKGKEFEVKFDLNALCNLQEKFGDISEAFDGLEQSDFKSIRSLLHVGLANGENINITEQEVGALIDLTNLNDVVDALTKAFKDANPESTEEGK